MEFKAPCEEEQEWERDSNKEELDSKAANKCREVAAGANYIAQDRPDIQYATKEIRRGMRRPTKGHSEKVRRPARDLVTVPRMAMSSYWQEEQLVLKGWSDSDFAWCRKQLGRPVAVS